MKNLFYIFFLAISLAGCNLEEDMVGVPEMPRPCGRYTALFSPEGYMINHLGGINEKVRVEEFQFLSRTKGFALARKNSGGKIALFKTDNGGVTWENLDLEDEYFPRDIAFKDENTGIVTTSGNRFILTEDGGQSWEAKYLPGYVYHLEFDTDGKLYAYHESSIIVSSDNGASWEVLYESEMLDLYIFSFSFELSENKIYISGEDDKIIVISKTGEYLKTIELEEKWVRYFEAIDDDSLVVLLSDQTLKSDDGGDSWATIYDRSARIIGFESSKKGVMLLNKGALPADYLESYDLIGVTENGGLEWIEAPETQTNLLSNFVGGQFIGEDRYLVMFDNCIFEIYPQ